MDDLSSRVARKAATVLRNARLKSGLSLREAARRAGTSHATLLAYENGEKHPSIVTYMRILEACGYAVDITLSRRIRERDGLARGDELVQVLRLAAAFPARASRELNLPVFARHA
ncbi:MAG: helix-turn-helix transcriptional regulator [Pseudomonadales bacterium]|nr:helix-turn-helix transcriptional regulator [Pseudomonadales bacterium]MCP5182992.1 helix-turn-helix transcriptional regulator [Pseudomonadales bacterium]